MPFTRAQLVAAAKERGYKVTDRLVTEWVRLGILDHPDRVGRTDGRRGAMYVWPDTQYHLFLTVLAMWSTVGHTKELVQIPVSVWLYWGEEWISLRQVRRAAETSVGLFGPPRSYERALANAREVVNQLKRPDAPRAAVAALRKALADGLYRGDIDPRALRPLTAAVLKIDPATEGWGPFGADVDQVVARLCATARAIRNLDSFTDSDYYEARAKLRVAILDYAQSWQEYACHPTYGHMFEPVTLELLVNRACRDLLFSLGQGRLARDSGLVPVPIDDSKWTRPPLELIAIR